MQKIGNLKNNLVAETFLRNQRAKNEIEIVKNVIIGFRFIGSRISLKEKECSYDSFHRNRENKISLQCQACQKTVDL